MTKGTNPTGQQIPRLKLVAANTNGRALGQPSIFKGTGGDGGGGNMLDRIAKLESDSGYIKRDIAEIKSDIKDIKEDAKEDFRILFGAVVFTALGLAGLIARGFHWI